MNEVQKLSVFETIREAWEKKEGAKKTIWGAVGIVFLFSLLFSAAEILSNNFWLIRLIANIVGLLLGAGLVYIGLRRVFDLSIQSTMVFKGFKLQFGLKYIGTVLLMIILSIALLLLSFLLDIALKHGQELSVHKLLIAFAYIVSFIILIFVMIRLSLSTRITVAQQVSPFKAIATSFRVTKGNFWRLLGLTLINVGIFIASILTIGIGFIWTIPYFILIWGVVYKKMIGISPQEL